MAAFNLCLRSDVGGLAEPATMRFASPPIRSHAESQSRGVSKLALVRRFDAKLRSC